MGDGEFSELERELIRLGVVALAGFVLQQALDWSFDGVSIAFGVRFANSLVVVSRVFLIAYVLLTYRYFRLLRRRLGAASVQYGAIRASHVVGTPWTEGYATTLERLLRWLSLFFGDAHWVGENRWAAWLFGVSARTLTWTALSFDRCLLVALVYSVAYIYGIWIVYGDAGAGGEALRLPAHEYLWNRIAVGIAIGTEVSCFSAATCSEGWRTLLWFLLALVFALIFSLTVAGPGTFIGDFALAIVVIGIGGFSGTVVSSCFVVFCAEFVGAFAHIGISVVGDTAHIELNALSDSSALRAVASVSFALQAVARRFGSLASSAFFVCGKGAGAIAVAGAFSIVIPSQSPLLYTFLVAGCVAFLSACAIRWNRQAEFLLIFVVVTIVACMFAVVALPHTMTPVAWAHASKFLFFCVLLPVLNAPFDFLALGLTRGLLWRGLQLGGPYPALLATLDAIAGLILAVILASLLVVAAAIFGKAEANAHQPLTLDLAVVLTEIKHKAGQSSNYWVYTLLLTTQAFSFINLSIGALSFLRGIPSISAWIHSQMPADAVLSEFKRARVAAVLAAETFFCWIGASLVLCSFMGGLFWVLLPIEYRLSMLIAGDWAS